MKKCPTCGREYDTTNTLCPADGTVLKKEGDDLIGKLLADKYRVEERLDEGGMGTVYRATHVLMEKAVAIKVLHPALAADDKIVARFTREARAASRISHPHALTVTDFGESDGIVFLVMEYLRGRTLKDIIRSEGPMPVERAVEIVRQVCGALEAAHAEGVVHRDLKSDNIMLEGFGAGGADWAKVLDFGIAKIQEPEGSTRDVDLTAPNLIIGTPQYMSPEQCSQASEIDSRSDLYSLGVIVYEMLVGHVPFTGDSPTAIMMKHLQEPPPSILEERDDLPPAVAQVVARSLSKRREDRFQTAGELSESFTLAATGEEVSADILATGASTSDGRHTVADTERIVVPTSTNERARATANEDYDEATVVSSAPRFEPEPPGVFAQSAPPPAASFNPWRIAIPALAVLAIIFIVFFAFNRGAGEAAPPADGEQPLTLDPNGQPVLSASPATGDSERDIRPGATTPGVPNALASPSPGAGGSSGGTVPVPNPSVDANDNRNVITDLTEPTPTPTPNPRRVPPSLQASPTPDATDETDDAPPVPTPKPSRPKPDATPAPPSTTDNEPAEKGEPAPFRRGS